VRVFLGSEKKKYRIVVFSILFIYFISFIVLGRNGFISYVKNQNEVFKYSKVKNQLLVEIENLKTTISNFENDLFYTEQVAREELLCGKPEELVYILK